MAKWGSLKNPMTEAANQRDVARMRKILNMSPVDKGVVRNCLRCGKEFLSQGKQNRMCGCGGSGSTI